jgi:hypothetical protein
MSRILRCAACAKRIRLKSLEILDRSRIVSAILSGGLFWPKAEIAAGVEDDTNRRRCRARRLQWIHHKGGCASGHDLTSCRHPSESEAERSMI